MPSDIPSLLVPVTLVEPCDPWPQPPRSAPCPLDEDLQPQPRTPLPDRDPAWRDTPEPGPGASK